MVSEVDLEQRAAARRARRRALRHATGRILPTLATLGNLICGFAAIYCTAKASGGTFALEGQKLTYFTVAGWLIFLAMIFDALDGRLARIVRSTSDLGAQLDSLADVISFGVAPAFLMLQLLAHRRFGGELFQEAWITEGQFVGRAIWVIGAIFVCCAALRLARFNVETTADESAHMWFKGLPSPGGAAALASLMLLMEGLVRRLAAPWAVQAIFWLLPPAALVTALMMVSSVPYPHAINHFIRGRHPFRNLVLAMLIVGLLLIGLQAALAIVSVGYALSGPVILFYRRLVQKDYRSADELAADLVAEDDEADAEDAEPAE